MQPTGNLSSYIFLIVSCRTSLDRLFSAPLCVCSAGRMRVEKLGVPVYDLGSLRSLWEVRTRKHKQRQKKEKERVEKSALAK